MYRIANVAAVIATAITVAVAAAVIVPSLAAEDWNTAVLRGVAMSVYVETDDNTGTVVRRTIQILTGSELIAVECLPNDIDCGFSLLDSCSATENAVGGIDFVNHSFLEEVCLGNHGSCLYVKGFLHTSSGGRLQMIATTTTPQSLGYCSPH